MHDRLFDYCTCYGKQPLTDAEKHTVKEIWEPRELRKRQYFVEEGKLCHHTGFVLKGALRQFRVDETGMEHVLQLAIENWWIADRDSFLHGTPSRYIIEAWEACELLQMHRSQLDTFLGIPAVRSMFWEMDQNKFIAAQKRLGGRDQSSGPGAL